MTFTHLLVLAQGQGQVNQITSPETFTAPNGTELDPDFWTVTQMNYAEVTTNSISATIQSNQLNISIDATYNGSGYGAAGYIIKSKYYLHGDFDIQADIPYTTGTANNKAFGFGVESTGVSVMSGPMVYRNTKYVATWFPSHSRINVTNATKYRLIRTGTTYTSQYWNGSWNQLSTEDKGIAPSVNIMLVPHSYHSINEPGSGTSSMSIDNITWTADTVSWDP